MTHLIPIYKEVLNPFVSLFFCLKHNKKLKYKTKKMKKIIKLFKMKIKNDIMKLSNKKTMNHKISSNLAKQIYPG